jgi:hypothetical protein
VRRPSLTAQSKNAAFRKNVWRPFVADYRCDCGWLLWEKVTRVQRGLNLSDGSRTSEEEHFAL